MNLQEFQAKRIFARYGVPIPEGDVAATPAEAREVAARLGGPVVVKAQVLVGGRGKAGGIKLAKDADEAEQMARQILGMEIKGITVRKVLVDQALSIADELYLGVVIDRAARRVAMMASSEGGVDIEEVAARTPDKIVKVLVDPTLGFQDYQAWDLALGMGLDRSLGRAFAAIARGLYRAFMDSDASLAEINPLVVTADGQLIGADGKMVLDDSALFRHADLAGLRDLEAEEPLEIQARESGFSYVKLDGEIGCMVNGAGLAMATMDITKLYGGAPANFLDVGGGVQADTAATALRMIFADDDVKVVLVNIFGGITRCDEVARGILAALDEVKPTVPMVIRLVGTNEEEGRRLLADAVGAAVVGGMDMITASTLAEAAQKAVAAAKGEVR